MSFYSKMFGLVVAVIAVATTVACQTQATQEGAEGNLEFMYSPADDSTDFERPIAVGSGMTMYVQPLGSRGMDEIVDVSSSSTSIIETEVDDGASDAFHLIGRSEGEAEIVVEARGDGETYTDRMNFRAGEVEAVRMNHRCTNHYDAAYVIDNPVSLEFERRNDGGEKLIGGANSGSDAVTSCQVWVEPEGLQDVPYCDEAGLHFPNISEFGLVELFLVDEVAVASGGEPDVGVQVVDPDTMQFEEPVEALSVNQSTDLELRPYVNPVTAEGTWDVCTNMELEVEILTPDVCSGSLGGNTSFTIDRDDENEIRLRGESAGYCDFDVYLADRPELAPWQMTVVVED